MWDIVRDVFDTLENVGLFEVANLSLDESQLENIIFNDNEDDIDVEENEAGTTKD